MKRDRSTTIKESSFNAWTVAALFLFVPGTAVISPDGRLVCLALAGVCAVLAFLSGKEIRKRVIAALVMFAALAAAISAYSEHQVAYDKYRKAPSAKPSPVNL